MKLSTLLLSLFLLGGCSRDNAATPDASRGDSSTAKPDSAVGSAPAQPHYYDTAGQAYRDTSHLPKSGGAVILIPDIASVRLKNDAARISEAYATEHGVQLKIGYAGGCREHTLSLHAVEALEKADPPIGHLYLSHDAGGDNCEAFITSDHTWDLAPLLTHYRDVAKHTGPVRLMIHEPGGAEPAQSIMVEVR